MKRSAITLSILASLYAGQVFSVQQQEPPTHPEVIEENEPDELNIVRDVDEQGSELEAAEFDLNMEIGPMSLQEAVDIPSRSPANRERDRYRNPSETLEFFGLEPNMTVV